MHGYIFQTSVKMAVLLHKQATMPFHLIIAVCYIPFWKAQECGINAWESQGQGCMFILRQTSVKMAVLLHKQATMPFHSIIAVYILTSCIAKQILSKYIPNVLTCTLNLQIYTKKVCMEIKRWFFKEFFPTWVRNVGENVRNIQPSVYFSHSVSLPNKNCILLVFSFIKLHKKTFLCKLLSLCLRPVPKITSL